MHTLLVLNTEKREQLTIPLPLVASDETSAITAIERLTLPLLMPPITLANTNRAKFLDNAHITYENAIPNCFRKKNKWKHVKIKLHSQVNKGE